MHVTTERVTRHESRFDGRVAAELWLPARAKRALGPSTWLKCVAVGCGSGGDAWCAIDLDEINGEAVSAVDSLADRVVALAQVVARVDAAMQQPSPQRPAHELRLGLPLIATSGQAALALAAEARYPVRAIHRVDLVTDNVAVVPYRSERPMNRLFQFAAGGRCVDAPQEPFDRGAVEEIAAALRPETTRENPQTCLCKYDIRRQSWVLIFAL
jgi:hypothetical protein